MALVSASQSIFDAIIAFINYDIKKLIMMQKLVPRTTGLKLTKIGQVDRVLAAYLLAGILSVYLQRSAFDIARLGDVGPPHSLLADNDQDYFASFRYDSGKKSGNACVGKLLVLNYHR